MNNNNDITHHFDSNNYEFNTGSKTGIMLIHGFSSTTYEFNKLAKFLIENDIYVRLENLPGHGTNIEDCNSYKYTDWLKFVEMRFADMSSRCENLFVLGISMGALLAMHLSVLFPINGLISAAPVLEFNKPFKIHYLNPIFCRLLKYRDKKLETNPGQKLFYGYNKWPLIGVNEVRKLSNYTNKFIVPKICCPSLMIHSRMDYTSVFNNYNILKEKLNGRNAKYLIIDKSTHNMFDCEVEKDILQNNILQFIKDNVK